MSVNKNILTFSSFSFDLVPLWYSSQTLCGYNHFNFLQENSERLRIISGQPKWPKHVRSFITVLYVKIFLSYISISFFFVVLRSLIWLVQERFVFRPLFSLCSKWSFLSCLHPRFIPYWQPHYKRVGKVREVAGLVERAWESWIWCLLLLLAMVVKVSVVLRWLEEPVVREKEAQRADVESVDFY